MPPRRLDLSGERFGRLTVMSYVGKHPDGRVIWSCHCDCGNETEATTANLRRGKTRSCGCLKAEILKVVGLQHGYFGTRMYRIWAGLNSRCLNPDNKDYPKYGGRGITVCERWRSFENFHADMIEGYDDSLSIDRIDVDGNYEPSNCRWATASRQAENRRTTKPIEWRGRAMSIAAWSKETGIPVEAIRSRIRKGWDIDRALTQKPKWTRKKAS
jgi:hypothetical protein